MGEGKWIPDVKASTAVAKAARKALELRMETVREALAPALDALSADAELVHHLRVGVRRATAALDLFADCLPQNVYRKARRGLRDLRRSAGQARDWDVFLLTLKDEGHRRGGLAFLQAYAQGHRVAAQALLTEAATEFSHRFSRRWDGVIRQLDSPAGSHGPRTLAALASNVLADQLRELREAAANEPTDLAHLHRVRIIGKRLRYSMEIVAGCFDETFREQLYPRVEQMQEILGLLNDSRVAGQRLDELRERLRAVDPAEWRKARPEITYWSRFHQRRLERQRRAFLKWLRQWELSRTEDEFCAVLELADAGA